MNNIQIIKFDIRFSPEMFTNYSTMMLFMSGVLSYTS